MQWSDLVGSVVVPLVTALGAAYGMHRKYALAQRKTDDTRELHNGEERSRFRKELWEHIARLEAENAGLRADRDRMLARINVLERALIEVERLKLAVAVAEASAEHLTSQLGRANAEVKRLEVELSTLREETIRLDALIDAFRKNGSTKT